MTIHLIKLSVGPQKLSDLAERQARELKAMARARKTPELVHVTRHMPRRSEEVLDGGSIYWVIKGWLCARQRLLELRPTLYDGVPHCMLVFDRELIRVAPRPVRVFQGWRYFAASDVPADLPPGSVEEDVPEEMWRELVTLGLL